MLFELVIPLLHYHSVIIIVFCSNVQKKKIIYTSKKNKTINNQIFYIQYNILHVVSIRQHYLITTGSETRLHNALLTSLNYMRCISNRNTSHIVQKR